MMTDAIAARCNAIEESYEFMLGYAGQGLAGEDGQSGGEIRNYLQRAAQALSGLADSYSQTVREEHFQPAERYSAFGSVLEGDARCALAAIELVLAQASISSQLVDNLNASIHLRSLLTDLFLIDEIFKSQQVRLKPAASGS